MFENFPHHTMLHTFSKLLLDYIIPLSQAVYQTSFPVCILDCDQLYETNITKLKRITQQLYTTHIPLKQKPLFSY